MSKAAARAVRLVAPAPPPLLLGPPLALPAGFGGDWAGATVEYDLDHLLEYEYVRDDLLRECDAAQRALDAARATLDRADDAAVAAHNARQRAANTHRLAVQAAWFVGRLTGPVSPPPGDVAAWEAVSPLVLRWLTRDGLDAAIGQMASPFARPAAAPSPGTGA